MRFDKVFEMYPLSGMQKLNGGAGHALRLGVLHILGLRCGKTTSEVAKSVRASFECGQDPHSWGRSTFPPVTPQEYGTSCQKVRFSKRPSDQPQTLHMHLSLTCLGEQISALHGVSENYPHMFLSSKS